MGELWFTADNHFMHENIIALCNRPFSSIEEMNEKIIENWNTVVHRRDTVWVVGDFAYRSNTEEVKTIFHRLNGHKHLIIGNHDAKSTLELPWSTAPCDRFLLKHNRSRYLLNHYPERIWDGFYDGTVHLYGHVHGRLPGVGRSLDVGVDAHNFTPVHSLQVLKLAQQQEADNPYDPEAPYRGTVITKSI